MLYFRSPKVYKQKPRQQWSEDPKLREWIIFIENSIKYAVSFV